MLNKNTTKQNSKQSVFRSDGRAVGHTEGDTLYKSVKGEKHMLQKPRGWAWDVDILEEAERRGATRVEIYDRENGKTYIATIQDYRDYGVSLNRGFSDQICLPLKYWQIVLPGQPPAKQLALAL